MLDPSQYKPTFPVGAIVDFGQGPQQIQPLSGTSNATIDPNTGLPRGTAPSLTNRYFPSGSTPAESPLEKARRELADQYKANSAAPDAQAIRDQVYKNSQAYLDAVGKRYDELYSQERQAGNIRNDQTRVFNIQSGNVGSDFASANAAGQEKQNVKALDAINQQRQLELAGIFDKLDQRARDEFEAKKEEAVGNAEKYVSYLQQNQADTLGKITDVAKAGLSLSEFKKQNTATGETVYDFIKRTTGKSDLELDALYQANLPATEKPVIHFEKVGNRILQFITNPKTGETKKNEYETDISDEEEFKEVDGVPYAVTKDANGKLVLRPLEGYTPNPKTQLELENQRLQNAKLRQDIAGGGDGGGSGGDNPQLYAGLSSKTATAVRAQVGAFKSEPIVTEFNVVNSGYNFAKALSNTTDNPSDDQGLIYAFAKIMDPGSVVREGEYATVQKYAQSWVKAYGKGVQQAIAGTGFLSESARANIKKTLETKYNIAKANYDNLYKQKVKGINNLTGRNDGDKFLTDYSGAYEGSDGQGATDEDLDYTINQNASKYQTREQLIDALVAASGLPKDTVASRVYSLIKDK